MDFQRPAGSAANLVRGMLITFKFKSPCFSRRFSDWAIEYVLVSATLTVAIPTFVPRDHLGRCLDALAAQSFRSFRAVVVDNSGMGLAREYARGFDFVDVIENSTNVGYGAAANQAFRRLPAEYFAVLNDDAAMRPECLEALIGALSADGGAGMAAPRILLAGTETLDSAGMLLARDGSSIQRGHTRSAASYDAPSEALFPSGCAAVYRSAMLAETGLFDEALFLYHEDTDLGLRARWLGWRCLYVPEAEVEHQYSASSGRASLTKAWYVERNRLRTVWKLFPLPDLLAAHFYSVARYLLHALSALSGHGRAAEFRAAGLPFWMLPWLVLKAHLHLMARLPEILRLRRRTPRRMTSRQFRAVLAAHRAGIGEVASH